MSQITIPKPELVDVGKLKLDGDNPNRMTDKQIERLSSSIKKYGFIVPIITNKDLLVADGEQRITIAKTLKMEQIPVIRLDVADVDRRLLRQVLNKLRGEHDLIADACEFEKIISAGHEDELKHLLDLTDSQLERYLTEIREPKDEDYEIPEIDKIKTDIERGDILKLGSHRLMCGDATSRKDIETLLEGQAPDLMFADPPYNIEYDFWDKTEDYETWNLRWFRYLTQMSKRTIMTIGMKNLAMWLTIEPKLKVGVWYKRNATTFGTFSKTRVWEPLIFYGKWDGHKSDFDVYDIPNKMQEEKKYHKSIKQLDLIITLVRDFSDKYVLDPFGGCGTTLIACEQTGRTCYMMEIDPRYCQVIVDRWQSYTGEKAEKLN